jgi:hypothetical protein
VYALQEDSMFNKQRKFLIFKFLNCSLFIKKLCKIIPGNFKKILKLLVEFWLNFPSFIRTLLKMNCLVSKICHRMFEFYTWLFNHSSSGLPSVADSYLDTFSALLPHISTSRVFFHRTKYCMLTVKLSTYNSCLYQQILG